MIQKTFDNSFKIDQILECGQCFRYQALEHQYYEVVAMERRLRIRQIHDQVIFDCDEATYERVWVPYFDLNRDYQKLKDGLVLLDHGLEVAIRDKHGLRILSQDPFEMMITFILSQNKAIPQIKVLVQRLCETYGVEKKDGFGSYYAFPTVEALSRVSEDEFRDLKVGFRGPYLVDAVQKVASGQIQLECLYDLSSNEARLELMKIKGIGQKVADCVLLFAYHKLDVFPLDVWVRRMMIHSYFSGQQINDQKILEFADQYFGKIGGLAQQYLFYYGRDHQIGK